MGGDENANGAQNRRDTNQNQNQNLPPAQPRRALDASSVLPSVALIFLTLNTAVAVYRARDNPWLAAFVALSFLDLLLLFYCLHRFVAAPPNSNSNSNSNSPRRRLLRTAVWFLSSFLTVTFSYGVADMTLAVVWCAAALAAGLGFCCLSIYAPDSYF